MCILVVKRSEIDQIMKIQEDVEGTHMHIVRYEH